MCGLLDRFNHAKYPFVEKVHGINSHFSDNGLFGVSIEGAGSHSSQLLGTALENLNRLKDKITDEDL